MKAASSESGVTAAQWSLTPISAGYLRVRDMLAKNGKCDVLQMGESGSLELPVQLIATWQRAPFGLVARGLAEATPERSTLLQLQSYCAIHAPCHFKICISYRLQSLLW